MMNYLITCHRDWQSVCRFLGSITISDANLEHLNLILNEDDSYMKEYVNDQEGEIYAIEYQKIKE